MYFRQQPFMAESPLDVNEKIMQCKADFGPGMSLGFRMLL
jgi:hypothetical protein